jgi:outer membrane immunogenic protein
MPISRQILMATAGAFALAGTAFAADLPPAAPPPPVPLFTWTGIYIGGQIGYAWGSQSVSYGDGLGFSSGFGYSADGVIGGGHVGYNVQLSQVVFGLEGDVDGASLKKSVAINPGVPITYSAAANV